MSTVTAEEIRVLRQMTVGELKEKYREVFGEESRSWNRDFLWKRIAWRLQALVEGGISERARQRARELANDADLRTNAPKKMPQTSPPGGHTTTSRFSPSGERRLPMPGTVLTREYNGGTISVTVLENGFEYEGQIYKTLTAVTKAVTGSHWNGFHFFGLGQKGGGN